MPVSPPIPVLSLGMRLGAADGSAHAVLSEHRDALAASYGEPAIMDLERAMHGDADAARRFAHALVPGSTFTVTAGSRGDSAVAYRMADGTLAGKTASRALPEAQLIASAAIHLWEKMAFRAHA